MTWTAEHVEQLTALWAQGLSCSMIAKEIGGGVSASSVSGKVGRLGLPRPERKQPVERSAPRSLVNGGGIVISMQSRAASREKVKLPHNLSLEGFNSSITTDQRRTLLELTDATCRWPIGDPGQPDFFFCGAAPSFGHPYCAGHCFFAYQEHHR